MGGLKARATRNAAEQLRALGAEDHLRFAADVVNRSALPESVNKELHQQIRRIQNRYADPNLYLAVIGEFSSGKSTFINALLRDDLLPTSALITTATATKIRYGDKLSVKARFRKSGEGGQLRPTISVGSDERVAAEWPPSVHGMNSREFLHAAISDDRVAGSIADVTIAHPASFLADHVVIIDTPGTNTPHRDHDQITRRVLRDEADAAIVIIPATTPLSQSLTRFLDGQLRPFLDRCLFVITKMSLIDASQHDILLKSLQARLARSLQIDPPKMYPCSPQVVTGDLHTETPEQAQIWSKQFAELEAVVGQRVRYERFLDISERVLRLLDEMFERLDAHLQARWEQYEARRTVLEQETIQDLPSFAAEQRKACDRMLSKSISTAASKLPQIAKKHREKTTSEMRKAIFDAQSVENLNSFIEKKAEALLEKHQRLFRKDIQLESERLLAEASDVGHYFDTRFAEMYRRLQALGGRVKGNLTYGGKEETGTSVLLSSMQSTQDVLADKEGNYFVKGAVAGAAIAVVVPVIGPIVGGLIGGVVGMLFAPSLDDRKQEYWDGLAPALDEYFAQLEKQAQSTMRHFGKKIRAAVKAHIDSHVTRYKEAVEGMRKEQENELWQLQGLQRRVKDDLSEISRRRESLKAIRERSVRTE